MLQSALIDAIALFFQVYRRLVFRIVQKLHNRRDRVCLEKFLPQICQLRQVFMVLRNESAPSKKVVKPRLKPLRIHRLHRLRVRFQNRIYDIRYDEA